MRRTLDIALAPSAAASPAAIEERVREMLAFDTGELEAVRIVKRSVDARSRQIKVNLRVEAFLDEPAPVIFYATPLPDVSGAREVIIVGAGPAGLFAALRCAELGMKPVVLERGKDVRSRRRDLAALNRAHVVNADSNYCFGEGGAGTYSDGKLYTRSTKRGDVSRVLETFVAHGADADILVDAHPHIGTDKLPAIVVSMRQALVAAGAAVHFNTTVTDFVLRDRSICGVRAVRDTHEIELFATDVILATGHSARDIYELLQRRNVRMELKPFAAGVRVEHPQSLIDSVQYHCRAKDLPSLRAHLPAASYSLVHQSRGRGVYSFCMCPGGIIAPCATNPGEVVTNGWSPSKRNNPWANSGVVVALHAEDFLDHDDDGPLTALRYQQALERTACEAGGGTQTAPAQRLADFCEGRLSASLPVSSYRPGTRSAPLHELLPLGIRERLQDGLRAFGKKLKGFYTNEAVVHGVETRTSSPVRIPRDLETLQHPDVKGLYPCAEGAGYAGGIVSAAIDGRRCAEQIAAKRGG